MVFLTCTKDKCSRTGFMGMNISFSILGAALLIASCIVRFDHNMADKNLGYLQFQKALQNANVIVRTPSTLNMGETLHVVCNVFIIIGVLFLLLGIFGTVAAIVRLKALLITMETFIIDSLKDSIRNDYSGITGNDLDTLRWNFIMHSFQCCGVNIYTEFRELPAKKWNVAITANNFITGKKVPFACCKVKNDTSCVLNPNNKTSFIAKGCYQVMRNWITNNTGVLVGVGICVLIIEVILVVLAFVIYCALRKKTNEREEEEIRPIQRFKLPHAHLVPRNHNLLFPGDANTAPAYDSPISHEKSVHQYKDVLNHYEQPIDAYDNIPGLLKRFT
ncbi:hypothetical protein ACJMK2_026954 [Sinanodonta woodiana]|uniref:Tetraspanin n=1 Tax=Sinanodonta woodiana TaxID=1069815 RepID=A0ABD3XNG9_SINWO